LQNLETDAAKLAKQYLSLGGKRRSKLDDNLVSTRQWEDEPGEATAFWEEKIANLPEPRRTEVETQLPSINAD
jgi:hypothetical protein